MKTNFRTLVATSLTLGAMAMLTGCGGGGTNAGANIVATELAQSYTLEIIEAPVGGWSMDMTGISPNGAMVGTYKVGETRHVFRYKNGVRADMTHGEQDYVPVAINDMGMIAGSYDTDTATLPFSITNSNVDNPALMDQAVEGWIIGFDATGQKYTCYDMQDGTRQVSKTKNGVETPMSINGINDGCIYAVSANGHMVGFAKSGGEYKKTAFDPATSTWSDVLAGTTNAWVNQINDSGSFVGSEKIGGKYVPFAEIGGVHMNPPEVGGTYGSFSGINAGNIAVGGDQVQDGAYKVYHAFGWSQGAGYVDLNTRIAAANGFVAHFARGIDGQGRIVGYGYKSGNQVGFILTPVKN